MPKTYRVSKIARAWEGYISLAPSTCAERLRAHARRLGQTARYRLTYREAIAALANDNWTQYPPPPIDGKIRKSVHAPNTCYKCGKKLDGSSDYLCRECYADQIMPAREGHK